MAVRTLSLSLSLPQILERGTPGPSAAFPEAVAVGWPQVVARMVAFAADPANYAKANTPRRPPRSGVGSGVARPGGEGTCVLVFRLLRFHLVRARSCHAAEEPTPLPLPLTPPRSPLEGPKESAYMDRLGLGAAAEDAPPLPAQAPVAVGDLPLAQRTDYQAKQVGGSVIFACVIMAEGGAFLWCGCFFRFRLPCAWHASPHARRRRLVRCVCWGRICWWTWAW